MPDNYRSGSYIRKFLQEGRINHEECTHLSMITDSPPDGEGCQQCLDLGDTWVNLRVCMICGQVGCCDSSKNKHASKHFAETGHPIMQNFMPGENWLWCFLDQVGFEIP